MSVLFVLWHYCYISGSFVFSALIHKAKCHNTNVLTGYALSSIFTGSFEVNGSLHNVGATSGGTKINKEKLLCD
jgi:hypothetical protein